jgi:hypothetical protein
MPKLTIKLTTFALAVLALLGSAASLAQDQRWFRVELLVFANESKAQPVGAATAEQWDATPTLAYPVASRFLVDPAQVAGNKAEFGGDSVLDEYGRQIITILTEPLPGSGQAVAPVPTPAPARAPAPLTPVYSEPVAAASRPDAEQPGVEQPMTAPPSLPRPFVLLPRGYQEFSGKAALMQRGGRYSILFHETWVQPVAPEASSLPIVLDHSGDTQQWPRLQGTIKLSLSRYLQLETNLWLNTAGEYLPGTWRMPQPPFGPPSLIIEEEQIVDVAAAMAEMPAAMAPGDDAAAALATTDAAGNMILAEAAATPDAGLPAAVGPETSEVPEAVEVAESAAPVYPYRHAVLLEQARRMRSGEVHYIDHPMLGLIIKFTPVTAEQLAAIAAEESGALEAGQGQ